MSSRNEVKSGSLETLKKTPDDKRKPKKAQKQLYAFVNKTHASIHLNSQQHLALRYRGFY